MKFIVIFLMCFCCVECNFPYHVAIDTLETIEITIPITIVRNYVKKYLSEETIFLSISSASSSFEQRVLQDDIVSHFLKQPAINNFSYTILKDLIYQFRRRNRDIFNIIFVDGSESLT